MRDSVNNFHISRRLGRDLAWQFFKDKFVLLSERYSSGFLLSRLVKSCSADLLGEERAREVEQFFVDHPLPGSERNVAQAVETIHDEVPTDNDEIFNEHLSTASLLPVSAIERLSSPSVWWEVTPNKVFKAAGLR